MDLTELYRLIRRWEGCHLVPYLCPAGIWTCGWGSTGPDVIPGVAWTQEYADRRMEMDALRFASASVRLCPGLGDTQVAALADFAYNLGVGALRGSTLRRKINAGDMDGAAKEIMKWVNAGGKRLRGLELRRAAERQLLVGY